MSAYYQLLSYDYDANHPLIRLLVVFLAVAMCIYIIYIYIYIYISVNMQALYIWCILRAWNPCSGFVLV